MKGNLAWIIFGLAVMVCLLWIGFGVRDDLREDDVFHHIIQQRIDNAKAKSGDVQIGVAGDLTRHRAIAQGVEIAAGEINAGGGILGRKIVLDTRNDEGTIDGALAIAQEFAANPAMPFVIGHTQSHINAEVAQNYEFYGLLRISPNTAGGGTSENTFSLLFENGMPPNQTGGAILSIAKEKHWKRLGLIYENSDYAMRQARRFESMANKLEMEIPLAFRYEGTDAEISTHIDRWKRELDLDAVVFAINGHETLGLISTCRKLGITCPFVVLGDRPVISDEMAQSLGALYFPAPDKSEAYAHFATMYQNRFGEQPSADALLGYDTARILAQTIRKANSFVPTEVAAELKNSLVTDSLSGTLRFDPKGTAIKRPPAFSSL